MIIHIRVFGLYPNPIEDYDPLHGLTVELPERSTVKELLKILNIKELESGIVVFKCRVLKPETPLEDGMELSVCRAVSGG